jgi:MoaD family protein
MRFNLKQFINIASRYHLCVGVKKLEVKAVYLNPLRRITGIAEEKFEVGESSTMEDLLTLLSKKYGPEFENFVFSGIKQPGLRIIFLLNETNVLNLEGLNTKLMDGCTVTLLPPLAGG